MTSHSHVRRRPRGFTMVELIVVMVLVGILGAVAVARFFDRTGFDANAYTEQTRAMLRYAQKVAIAQHREVFVRLGSNAISLCFDSATPCPADAQVLAPSGTNSGSAATREACASATWYCEATPTGIGQVASSGANSFFRFDALGRPSGADGVASRFAGLTITIKGDGADHPIAVAPETGYVY